MGSQVGRGACAWWRVRSTNDAESKVSSFTVTLTKVCKFWLTVLSECRYVDGAKSVQFPGPDD
jgi:hypothetical protein